MRLVFTRMDGELRVLDTALAKCLGFAKAVKIRDLIKRQKNNLKGFGEVAEIFETSGANGGGLTACFYLNPMQAFTVAARSDLPFSDEVSVKILNSVDEMAASNEKTFSLELGNAMTPKVTSTPVVDITPSMCDGELRVLDVDLCQVSWFYQGREHTHANQAASSCFGAFLHCLHGADSETRPENYRVLP